MTEAREYPLVSVIIPLYNCADYIGECLDSVISQKYKNIEIIVVDDGSTDNGAEIAAKYTNVTLLRQSNQGVTAARKAGVENSAGEWIMFVDADDTVEENIISCWLTLMRPNTDIIIGRMKRNKEISPEDLINDALKLRLFPRAPWQKLFRRQLFESGNVFDIPRSIEWGEDLLMLVRLSLNSKGEVTYSRERNYHYRRHPSQITKRFHITSDYQRQFHSLLIESIPQERMTRDLMHAICSYRLHLYEQMLRDGKYTHDDIKRSEWFDTLNQDIVFSAYKTSIWFKMLLRFGNSSNINDLRRFKWVFKCFNAV